MKNHTTCILLGICLLMVGASNGQIITTIAGIGSGGFSGDGAAATAAKLTSPSGVTVDSAGNIYIADAGNNRIRKVNTSGGISTIAGTGTAGFSGDGSAALTAKLSGPSDVAIDRGGNIYIADYGNNRIRKINAAGTISTYAGNGSAGYSGDGGAATAATLHSPYAITLDAGRNLYIADFANNRVRKVNTSHIITTLAGNGTGGYIGDGMAATATEISNPIGVAIDRAGNIYISDNGNNRIRKVDTSGTICTFAGTGGTGSAGDGGAATSATMNYPSGIVADGGGNLYISDYGNAKVRRVSASGVISTYAGNGSYAYYGDGGAATAAALSVPYGLSVNGRGDLFIADEGNNCVRKVAGCLPAVGVVAGVSLICFGAVTALTDTTPGGSWSSSNISVATVSSSGVVTGLSAGGVIISYAVTNGCGIVAMTLPLTVIPLPDSGIISGVDTLCQGDTATFMNTVTGGTWSSGATSIVTIDGSTGLATAIAAGVASISYSVTNICGTSSAVAPVVVLSTTSCAANISTPAMLNGINIFPNPVHDIFSIELPKNEEGLQIQVTNVLGQNVKFFKAIDIGTQKMSVDISDIPHGIYLVKITTGTKQYWTKIAVE